MFQRPRKFKSEFARSVFDVQMRKERDGSLFYYVEWYRDNEPIAISFESMSSVLDFLKSNF